MRTCFIARYITIFLVVLGLTESNLAQSQDKLNGYEIETWLKKAMKMQPAVLFRSHGGQIYRTDSDTDIVFFANHKIVILDYGYGFTVSCGTYEVLTGNIKLHLIGARKKHPFPSLFMYQLQRGIYLTSEEISGYSAIEQNFSAENNEVKPFWPFKYVQGGAIGIQAGIDEVKVNGKIYSCVD